MLASYSAFTTRFALFPDKPSYLPCVCAIGRTLAFLFVTLLREIVIDRLTDQCRARSLLFFG